MWQYHMQQYHTQPNKAENCCQNQTSELKERSPIKLLFEFEPTISKLKRQFGIQADSKCGMLTISATTAGHLLSYSYYNLTYNNNKTQFQYQSLPQS